MSSRTTLRRALAGATMALVAALALPGSASAGRLIVTGHDTEVHCSGSTASTGPHCHYLKVAAEYIRAGAPDPSKPLLLLTCSGTLGSQLSAGYDGAPPGSTQVCPSAPGFSLTTIDTSSFSGIVVGSAWMLTQAGSTALNTRKSDIEEFFNAGGGIFANTGLSVASYYDFLPLTVGAGANTGPYVLTPEGIALGLQDSQGGVGTFDDINCCMTHNSFNEPAPGGPLRVAERDANGKPMTLLAEGSISGGAIVGTLPAPATPATPATPAREPETAAPSPAGPVATPAVATPLPRPTIAGLLPGELRPAARTAVPEVVVRGSSLGVGCEIAGAALSRCDVTAYLVDSKGRRVGSSVVGRGTLQVAGTGTSRGSVRLALTAEARSLLRHDPTGLRVELSIAARPVGSAERLQVVRGAVLRAAHSVVVPDDGQFAFVDARLDVAQRRFIRSLVAGLRGARTVVCAGHTSNVHRRGGGRAVNMRLGARRAAAVCAQLRRAGFKGRTTTRSFGGTRPRASNRTEQGQALNRRVELHVRR